ncbi:MAG TPA: FKBP-type peptidyl-prolyl cis-trans isomerase [Rhizomicrobium sp.]|nr:FKBP-type peptidyl-prolyl cis-trans isomerase [Rhizomicrobium sp.]
MWRIGAVMAGALLVASVAAFAQTPDNSLSQEANKAFLAANAAKPGVHVRPSGLQYRIIKNGFGKTPAAVDTVEVLYKGNLINGKVFDQTEPELPAQFVVNGVIQGWTEALEIMREGDEWELVIPPNLAYGTRGQPPVIPPNQTLVFDVTLLKVTPAPPKQQESDQSSE